MSSVQVGHCHLFSYRWLTIPTHFFPFIMARNMLQSVLTFSAYALSAPLARRAAPSGVPSYVTKYAPIVYLYSTDPYRPSDISAQLTNTQPEINYTAITPSTSPLTLDNLNSSLSSYDGSDIYLTSTSDITTNPAWLNGVAPNSDGETVGAVSCAIIVNDHGSGLVDAFYMYFYAFNYGGDYFGFIVDDHVGDWEHNMVRFQDGVPTAVWYSQHSNGEAFTYETVQKWTDGLRVGLADLENA